MPKEIHLHRDGAAILVRFLAFGVAGVMFGVMCRGR